VKKLFRISSRVANEDGLTLIELMAVMAILAIIVSVAVPITLNAISKSKLNTQEQSFSVIQSALEQYAQDKSQYPTSATGLMSNALQPYLHSVGTNDTWGVPFEYGSDGSNYVLFAPNSDTHQNGVVASSTMNPSPAVNSSIGSATLTPSNVN